MIIKMGSKSENTYEQFGGAEQKVEAFVTEN